MIGVYRCDSTRCETQSIYAVHTGEHRFNRANNHYGVPCIRRTSNCNNFLGKLPEKVTVFFFGKFRDELSASSIKVVALIFFYLEFSYVVENILIFNILSRNEF